MKAKTFFSILIYASATNTEYFRDMLYSIATQTYEKYELIVLDDNPVSSLESVVHEYFRHNGGMNYRKLKKHEGRAYALNIGLHFAQGTHYLILGQHDRISPETLEEYAKLIKQEDPMLIYCDQDELVGDSRMNPHFKCGHNLELLRQDNYVGEFICFSRDALKAVGPFTEGIMEADIYDFLLRCTEKGIRFTHVERLFYHRRMMEVKDMNALRAMVRRSYEQHVAVVRRYFKRLGIDADVSVDSQYRFWKVRYDGSDYEKYKKDYLILRDKHIKVHTKSALKRMYGYLKQPDVAVVGVQFTSSPFKLLNAGYIFDQDGMIYPACYGKSTADSGYENRIILSQEVSMVDFGFCIIDAKIYKRLGGLNPSLTGRDSVLDFCLRVRAAGYRIICVSDVRVKNKENSSNGTESSHALFIEKWAAKLSEGDPYYNINLPMGLSNYQLF